MYSTDCQKSHLAKKKAQDTKKKIIANYKSEEKKYKSSIKIDNYSRKLSQIYDTMFA